MIIFAHGLEGSPQGTKVQAFAAAGVEITAPDFNGEALADRVLRLRAAIDVATQHNERVLLAGSSYGGLCAAAVAGAVAPHLCGLLLLAPAFGHREPGPQGEDEIVGANLVAPASVPTTVIHGHADTICSFSDSVAYVERSVEVRLVEVDDEHRLLNSLDTIVAEARVLLKA